MNFYVGQKVVCVDGTADLNRAESSWEKLPVRGDTYTIRGIHPDADAILLEEIKNPVWRYRNMVGEVHFLMRRFRALEEKPDAIEQFRQMCKDAEAGNLVDA